MAKERTITPIQAMHALGINRDELAQLIKKGQLQTVPGKGTHITTKSLERLLKTWYQ